MVAIIAKKLGMISMIDEAGRLRPVTLLAAQASTVVAVKTTAKDDYDAWQLAFGQKKNGKKPQIGQVKKAKLKQAPEVLREIRLEEGQAAGLSVGDKIGLEQFQVGDQVLAVGTAKGKGFSGNIKRHNFSRGPKSHGGKGYIRRSGSIGSLGVREVVKGKKMPGRLGGQRVTLGGLKVGLIDPEKEIIGIIGGLPGAKKSVIILKRPGDLIESQNLSEKTDSPPAATTATSPTTTPKSQSEESPVTPEAKPEVPVSKTEPSAGATETTTKESAEKADNRQPAKQEDSLEEK